MKSFALMFAVLIACLFADVAFAAPCATCSAGTPGVSCGDGAQRSGGPIRRGLRRLFGRRCR